MTTWVNGVQTSSGPPSGAAGGDLAGTYPDPTISPAYTATLVSASTLTANGDLLTRAAGVPAALPIGSAGNVLTVVGGAPSWQPASGGVTTGTYAGRPAAATAGAGAFYYVVDPSHPIYNHALYQSTGTAWRLVTFDRRPVYPTTGKLHWQFDEAQGATSIVNYGSLGATGDLSILGSNKLGAGSQWTQGGTTCLLNGGLDADKAYGASSAQPGTTALTMIAWVVPNSLLGWSGIVIKQISPGAWTFPFATVSMYVRDANNGTVEYRVTYDAGSTLTANSPSPALAVSQLAMLAMTWDGNTLRVYENGVLTTYNNVGGGAHSLYYNGGPWAVTSNPANGLESFSGRVLDVFVDDSIYTAAQILDAYQHGIGIWSGA